MPASLRKRPNCCDAAKYRDVPEAVIRSPRRHKRTLLIRGALLSEDPRSSASRLIARPGRSIQILEMRDRAQATAPPPHGPQHHVRDGRKRMRDSGKKTQRTGSDVGLSSLRRWPLQIDEAQ